MIEYIINTETTQVIRIKDKIETNEYFEYIKKNIKFSEQKIKIYGKIYIPKRKTYHMGDENIAYKYSGYRNKANKWDDKVKKIKDTIEKITKEKYNYCLLNYYENGNASIGWHSDDEKDIKKDSSIVSVSFGCKRLFKLKNKKTKEVKKIILENGDILIMKGKCQKEYWHSLPKTTKNKEERISLTFRNIKNNQ